MLFCALGGWTRMEEKDLKKRLMQENPEFKQNHLLHQECEKRLQELSNKVYLSEEEERELKETKKKKLALKDRMYYLITEYRKTHN